MWKKLRISRKPGGVSPVLKEWKEFIAGFEAFVESPKKPLSPKTVKKLQKIGHLLGREFENTSMQSLGPVLEDCLAQKVFSTLGHIIHTGALQGPILALFAGLLQAERASELLLQMDFNSSIQNVLAYFNAEEGLEVTEMTGLIAGLLKNIDHTLVEILFVGTEFLPANLLLVGIREEFEFADPLLLEALVELVQINNRQVEDAVLKTDLAMVIITKLAFCYQNTGTSAKLEQFARFVDELYQCSTWPRFKQKLFEYFTLDFLGVLLTPRLYSSEKSIRTTALSQFSVILKNFSSKKLLGAISSYLSRAPLKLDPLQEFVNNIHSTNEELYSETLRFIYFLLKKEGWPAVYKLFTNSFKGEQEPTHLWVDSETFISMFPSSVLHFRDKASFMSLSHSASQAVIEAWESMPASSLLEKSIDPGSSMETQPDGETGGTAHKQPFTEGPLLKAIHYRLKRFFTNSISTNLMLTGILSVLAAYPIHNSESKALHQVLFEPSTLKEQSILVTLQTLSVFFDTKLKSQASMSAMVQTVAMNWANDKPSNNSSTVKFLENCVLLQEFLRELALVLMYKDLPQKMTSTQTIVKN